MTSIEEHRRKIKEILDGIDMAIDQGVEKWPTLIGFNTSLGATQLLELYLHRINKIDVGKTIKHNWFKRPTKDQKQEPLIERKLGVDFPDKKEIFKLIYDIEKSRDKLVYGKSDRKLIMEVLKNFEKLKEHLLRKLKEERIEIG